MPPVKLPFNNFRKMKFPIEIRQNWKTKEWFIYDNDDRIIAEGLTNGDADTIKDAVNYIGKALRLLIDIIYTQSVMVPSAEASLPDIMTHASTTKEIFDLLVELGLIEPPKIDVHEGTKKWKEEMMQQLTNREEPEWTKLYHHLKLKGQLNEIDE